MKTEPEMREAAEDLLGLSLVDNSESENRLLAVWLEELHKGIQPAMADE